MKKAGCYGLGVLTAISLPGLYIDGVIFKGIGLAFDKNSFIEDGDAYLSAHKLVVDSFTEMPDRVLDTKITGSEVHYDIYDMEIPYYSNGEIGPAKIYNIRHQVQ